MSMVSGDEPGAAPVFDGNQKLRRPPDTRRRQLTDRAEAMLERSMVDGLAGADKARREVINNAAMEQALI